MNSRISCKGIPSCTRCGGSARISPNCRFEQISCKSASNTAMPWRTWFSAVCRISRLKCSAAWESSSSFSAALAETVRLRSSSDITRREEAAPIEEAIRRSACCSSSKSAGAGGSRLAGMAGGKGLERIAGALGAEILRHRALDVLHRDRWCASAGRSARSASACCGTNRSACSRSIEDGWRASDITT